MVKYYGRARERTASVNTTQLGLKLAGCPSNVGRKGTLTRVVQRRVNCALKVCGWRPVHGVIGRKPGIFNFPSEPVDLLAKEAWSGPFPCTLAQPFTRGVKGGIGHIYTPRTKCGCTCVADCSGIDDTFFPVGTPQYGLPRCAGGECCFLATNAPLCLTGNIEPPTTHAQPFVPVVHCFPGGNTNSAPGDGSWRGMVAQFFQQTGQETLPPLFAGFDSKCWITRQDAYDYHSIVGQALDLTFAIAVSPVSSPRLQPAPMGSGSGFYFSGLQEDLAGYDYINEQQKGRIDWAFLTDIPAATNLRCKDSGKGVWLLARTHNLDFTRGTDTSGGVYSNPQPTLTLYWLTRVNKGMQNTAPWVPWSPLGYSVPNSTMWSNGPQNPPDNQREYITAFPVLRYHAKPRGSKVENASPTDARVNIQEYTGDIALNECGCPEIPSGSVPPYFQYWGLFYPSFNYLDTPGLPIPWSFPSSYLQHDITHPPGDTLSVKWKDFPTVVTTSPTGRALPPVPGMWTDPNGNILPMWRKPESCTFGAVTNLGTGNLVVGTAPPDGNYLSIVDYLNTGVLRWFCPQPPPESSGWPPA